MSSPGFANRLPQPAADRFEILLNQRLTRRDLCGSIDTRIRRIHGRRVADLLQELLRRREEETQAAQDGLRLQYPSQAEETERRFLRCTSLRREERQYDSLCADGLIGRKLHATRKQDLAARRRQTKACPTLDLAVQKTEPIGRLPPSRSVMLQRRRIFEWAMRTPARSRTAAVGAAGG